MTFTAAVTSKPAAPSPPARSSSTSTAADFGGAGDARQRGATATLTLNSLDLGSHTVSAVYASNSADFVASTGSSSLTVEAPTVSNIQSVVNNAPSSSGGSVTLQTTSSTAVSTAVQAVNAANPSSPVTVTLDLGGATTTPTTAFNVPSGVQLDLTSSSGAATVTGRDGQQRHRGRRGQRRAVNWTVNGGNVTVQGSAMAGDFIVNGGTVTLADGTVITGNSPAIIVNGGNGHPPGSDRPDRHEFADDRGQRRQPLVRNSTIQESTGFAQAAILINGGTVDLGTAASPGGNTFNVNGTGTLIENTSGSPVPAVGDTFENNGTAIASDFGIVSLSAPSSQTANQGVPQPFNLGALRIR